MKKEINKILITGCNGFLGSNLSGYFKSNGSKVYGIDIKQIHSDFQDIFDTFILGEVSITNLLKFKNQFDLIIHCAGGSSVSYSIENPLSDFQMTVDTTSELLEYMRQYNESAVLIYPSSAAVYGNAIQFPINENAELRPISPYGYNKLSAEKLCEYYHNIYHLDIKIIRFFSLYGIGLKKQLLWDACNKFSNHEKPVFYGTGDEIRDWINIQDAMNLIYNVYDYDNDFLIMNGAYGSSTSNKNIISIISQYFNGKAFDFNGNLPNGDPVNLSADISQMRQLGFEPVVGLESGIAEYVEWFKQL